jgi:hypothetical protein
MSKAEILAELSNLTKEERFEIRVRLAEMDGGGWMDADDCQRSPALPYGLPSEGYLAPLGSLNDGEKALLEARLEDMEKHPETSIPWNEAEARLKARFAFYQTGTRGQ